LAIHIAESDEEDRFVREGAGEFADAHRRRGISVGPRAPSPVMLLNRLGILERRPLLIHCVRTREADIAAIARARAPIAHCPASNARLGHGVAPLTEWHKAGIPVGLGSDSMASNDRMHMLEEARLALFAQRFRGSSASVSPATALAMATIDGARCLGIDDRVGSLERGKDADFAAFSLDHLAAVPGDDPAVTAIFSLGGSSAHTVAVKGELRVCDGKVIDLPHDLVARVRLSRERMREAM
jgi:5-methylthioadenosine/S-adenosylhomocysteine deaminase